MVRWAALGGQDLTTGEELIVWKSDNLETHFFGAGCLPFLGINVMNAKKTPTGRILGWQGCQTTFFVKAREQTKMQKET